MERSRVVVGAALPFVHAAATRPQDTTTHTARQRSWIRRCADMVPGSIAPQTVPGHHGIRPDVCTIGTYCETGGVNIAVDDPAAIPEADDASDDVIVLPWWQNPWNVIAIVLGVLLLAGGAGFVIGERHAIPQPNSTDIGFLQDMRTHHEQAVEMSLIYISKTGTDANIELIAREIAFGQAVDSGRMIQLLRDYGKPEANLTDTAMSWMNAPVPYDRMPGLASTADLDALVRATGAAADQLYGKLMINHHEGGIHMAEFAAAHAATGEVVDMAKAMVSSQQEEITEMQRLLTAQ
jgi:uncharacterized protein (DUF305 family)